MKAMKRIKRILIFWAIQLKRLWRQVKLIAHKMKIYAVRSIENSAEKTVSGISRIYNEFEKKLILEGVRVFTRKGPLVLLFAITIGIALFVFYECSIAVQAGDTSVITRFGRYNRTVGAGLQFYIPYVERYFLINTNTLFEETFGFVQIKPPTDNIEITDQERQIQTQYENLIRRIETEPPGVLSSSGNLLDALEYKQRLTADYLRRKYAPRDNLPENSLQSFLAKSAVEARTGLSNNNIPLSGRIPQEENATLITGDLNVIHLTWTLQYNISSPEKYLFNSIDAQRNLRDIAIAVMNQVIGTEPFNRIITTDRENIENKVQEKTQKLSDDYGLGFNIKQVIILDALPVKQVQFAFNEVNKASQDMERIVYEAEREYLNIMPEARGEAQRIIAEAQAYAIVTVNEAKGEAGRFKAILTEYNKAPAITEDRLYIEAMRNILRKTPTTIIDQNVHGILPIFMNQKDIKNETTLLSTLNNNNLSSPQLATNTPIANPMTSLLSPPLTNRSLAFNTPTMPEQRVMEQTGTGVTNAGSVQQNANTTASGAIPSSVALANSANNNVVASSAPHATPVLAATPSPQPTLEAAAGTPPGPQAALEPAAGTLPGSQAALEPAAGTLPGSQAALEPAPAIAPGPQATLEAVPVTTPGPQATLEAVPATTPGPQATLEPATGTPSNPTTISAAEMAAELNHNVSSTSPNGNSVKP